MFDFSWGELLVVGVVALIAIGPKELPGVLRTVGQWMTKMRRLAAEFQGQFHEAIREAEMADLKKEVDEMTDKAKSYAHFDPLGDIQKDIENTIADKPAELAAATESSANVEPPAPVADAAGDEHATPAVTPEPAPPAAAKPESAVPELRHDAFPDAGAKPA
jgi:sec-independent protein translocase protein TatB